MLSNFKKIEESKAYVTESKRSRVFKFFKNKPNANIHELYAEFPEYKHELLKYYKWLFRAAYAPSLVSDKDHIEKIRALLDIFDHKTALTNQLTTKEQEVIKYFEELVKDK